MTFGYLGYIWAIFGCAIFGAIFLGSAMFLYGLARRGRSAGSEPLHTVETLPLPPRPPAPPPPDEAA